jgi:hypothetical protein
LKGERALQLAQLLSYQLAPALREFQYHAALLPASPRRPEQHLESARPSSAIGEPIVPRARSDVNHRMHEVLPQHVLLA